MYTVKQLIPARDQTAGLQLMILIDETLNIQAVGNNLTDLKEFVKAQPPTTAIGIGYMANTGVNVVQQFTTDHEAAVNAIRLPRGSLSTMDSPYLSLLSLVKGWSKQNIRREVLMITDGIDRLHGETLTASQLGPRFGARGTTGPTVYHSMPTISVDADSASETSQRYNVIVNSIYSPGVGRVARSSWDLDLGLGGLSKIADETGGECYFPRHLEPGQLQTLPRSFREKPQQPVLPGLFGGAKEERHPAAHQGLDRKTQLRNCGPR